MKRKDVNLALWGHGVTLPLLRVRLFRGVCHVRAHARAGQGRSRCWLLVSRPVFCSPSVSRERGSFLLCDAVSFLFLHADSSFQFLPRLGVIVVSYPLMRC